jgi:DHA2 family multidrug resistance protein
MLISRVIMGFGGGALLVRTLILARLMFLGKTRIFALSLFYLVLYSSEPLYPTAMGWISDTLRWNYAFLLDFPFLAIGVFLIWKYAPRGHLYLPNEKTYIDAWGGCSSSPSGPCRHLIR